jgi:hypothetical protein
MANEFVARKGLISSGSINVSGSVTASFFKGDGSQLSNLPSTNIASSVVNTNSFIGDGTTVSFTVDNSYTNNSLLVSVDGLFYTPTSDYTISGDNVIFASPPPSSSNITIRALVNIVSGGVGSYSGSFIGDGSGLSNIAFADSASTSISSSYALTASFALNGGGGGVGVGFPFSGSAVITGSLLVIPTGSVGGITGSFSGSGAGLTDINASLAIDNFTFVGDGITTDYILSQSYTQNSLIVTVEGIGFIAPNDFTISESTVSFVVAPPSQSNIAIKAFLAASSGSYINYTGSFIGNGAGLTNLPVNFDIQRYVFIGDGVTQNYILSQSYLPSGVVTTVGGLRNINDNDYTISGNTLQFVESPASNSIIVIDAFVNASSGSVGMFSGSFFGLAELTSSGHFTPAVSDIYDLGSPDKKWRSLYISGSTIYLGSLELKDSGGTFAVASETGDILPISGSFTGSLFGTSSLADNAISSSYATTASFASNVLKTKAGSVVNTSFGGTPLTASITFNTAFDNTNYAIAITGEDSRAWIVESKIASGFIINSVSNTELTGTTYWTCTSYGEN